MKPLSGEMPVLTAVVAAATGTTQFIAPADIVKIQLNTATSADGTIKFQVSDSDDPPTFSSAQSVTNKWDYAEIIDNEDGTAIDGDTGIALSGTDDHRNFTLNVDGARWFSATITTWTAGAWTVTAAQYATSS